MTYQLSSEKQQWLDAMLLSQEWCHYFSVTLLTDDNNNFTAMFYSLDEALALEQQIKTQCSGARFLERGLGCWVADALDNEKPSNQYAAKWVQQHRDRLERLKEKGDSHE